MAISLAKEKFSSESELIHNLRQEDNRALEYMYRQYGPMISHFVYLNQGSQEEAKDLFQDGLLILLEKLRNKNFTLQFNLKTYFYSICRNQWLKRWRDEKRFYIKDSEAYYENLSDQEDAEEADLPDDEEIYQAVKNLQDPCFTLLIGYYYKKMNLEEIARLLNYSNANVAKQRKFRCIERLKIKFL